MIGEISSLTKKPLLDINGFHLTRRVSLRYFLPFILLEKYRSSLRQKKIFVLRVLRLFFRLKYDKNKFFGLKNLLLDFSTTLPMDKF